MKNKRPRRIGMRQARNADAWAIGHLERNGFHVRRVVWGRILAREERRDDELIVRARVFIMGSPHK